MNKSLLSLIQSRLIIQIGLPLIVLAVLSGLIGFFTINRIMEALLTYQLQKRGEISAYSAQFAIESANSKGTIQRFIAALGAEDEFESVFLVLESNRKIIASTQLSMVDKNISSIEDPATLEFIEQGFVDRKSKFKIDKNVDHRDFIYRMPVNITNLFDQGKPLGIGMLYIKLDDRYFDKSSSEFLHVIRWMLFAFLVIFSSAFFLLLKRYVLRPQSHLLDVLRLRKEGKKVFVQTQEKNEFAVLADAFNDLLESNDEVDNLKSEFVSTVSHELRTPLTAIKGGLGVVLGAFSKDIPEQPKSLLTTAQRNAEQLGLLINDLLDMEKMASGKLEYQFLELDMVKQIQQAIQRNEHYALQHGVQLQTILSCNEAWVSADEHRLQQIFANLLSNAIKFSPRGETVRVELEVLDKQICIKVIDKGRGIPEKFQKRIFQRFAQADSTDAREKRGTGLGLSIVKMIVEAHQGKIGFVSEEGKGAEFYFYLPLLKP